MQPKVSVIIPVYNDAEFLEECMSSVINQTLQDIEIICVDDASTDGSKKILKKFADCDSRIKLIFHNINMSASIARKNGVLASSGKYIMFVDGDDKLADNACFTAYDVIVRKSVDIVQFGTKIKNCAGVPENRIKSNQNLLKPFFDKLDNADLVIECFQNKKFGFQLWNKIYNADIVKTALSEVENISLPKAQDLYAFFLIASQCRSYCGIKNELYQYNFGRGITGGNIMSLDKFQILCQEKDVVGCLLRYIKNKNLSNYKSIVEEIDKHFKNECITRWENNLSSSDRSKGFDILVEKFQFQSIIDYYATKYWFDNLELADKFKNLDFMQSKTRNKTKITIAAYYRSIENGGAQRVVAMLCNRWAEMSNKNGEKLYNVVLIVDDEQGKEEYDISPEVIREYLPSRVNAVKSNYISRYKAWQDIIEKNNIDIVISSMWVDPCTFWDMISVKSHVSRPFFCIHAHNFAILPYSFNGSRGFRQNKIYELCDGIVTLSKVDQIYISAFNNIVHTILNPILFNPHLVETSKVKRNSKKILWLGRISKEKNPVDAILLMQEIVKQIPDAHLDIVGSGDNAIEKKMRDLVQEYSLTSNVTFHGFQIDVEKYYLENGLFINTSSYEGFPLTLAEAMAHALPVITYDMPWLTFIRDGRGIITVPQRNYKVMALAIMNLINNNNQMEEVSESGKQQICDIFDHDILKDWQNFFEDVNSKTGKLCNNYNEYRIIYQYLVKYTEIKMNKNNSGDSHNLTHQSSKKYKYDMYILKKLVGGINCYREHGLSYTIKRCIKKLYHILN